MKVCNVPLLQQATGWSESCNTIKVCEMKPVFQFICQLLKQHKKGLSSWKWTCHRYSYANESLPFGKDRLILQLTSTIKLKSYLEFFSPFAKAGSCGSDRRQGPWQDFNLSHKCNCVDIICSDFRYAKHFTRCHSTAWF